MDDDDNVSNFRRFNLDISPAMTGQSTPTAGQETPIEAEVGAPFEVLRHM
jgi:hypothetical protein